MPLNIRLAQKQELEWINEKYDEVGFPHSNFETDFVAIAELDGQRVGLGRLIRIDELNAEMGGMYVFEEFRKQGIAEAIINFLLIKSHIFKFVYCLPFADLKNYYKKFGFQELDDEINIPEKIASKFQWCKDTIDREVIILVYRN